MSQNRETAYAKVNLALHVREQLPDGYHRIETVFAFDVVDDHIKHIWVIRNPEKLHAWSAGLTSTKDPE